MCHSCTIVRHIRTLLVVTVYVVDGFVCWAYNTSQFVSKPVGCQMRYRPPQVRSLGNNWCYPYQSELNCTDIHIKTERSLSFRPEWYGLNQALRMLRL